ncbi:MAG: [NiFe]-hydrogenase assembly chaperone HybE [Gemmatimonadota bacterium]
MTAVASAPGLLPAEKLETTFRAIHAERMHGMPLVNEALRVEAVGFRRWEGRWLGVLITPWFMSLVLLPDVPGQWRSVPVRGSTGYVFPAGVFDFIGGHEPALGEFQSCSLFSPMFEFAQHEVARATAEAVLAALFDAGTRAEPAAPRTVMCEGPDATAAAPVSKRDFLRGRWHGEST